MIVKSRNKEYKVKYEYENFKCYINTTDKHTFGLISENGDYISSSSETSFLEAEENVYLKYLKFLECDHDWVRSYPHSKFGHCTKCRLTNQFKFESPYACEQDDCNELGDFSLLSGLGFTSKSKHYCLNHYRSNLKLEISKNIENFDEIEMEDIDYFISLIFTDLTLDQIHDKEDFISKNVNEKETYIDQLSYFYFQNELKRELFSQCEELNIKPNNGIFWNYRGNIRPEDVQLFVDMHLRTEGYIDKDINSEHKETREKIKNIIKKVVKNQ